MEKQIVDFIKDVFGVEPICINCETVEEIAKEINRRRVINMIDDTRRVAKALTKPIEKVENEDIANAAVAFINASKFDNNDAELVGVDEVKRLAENIDVIRGKLNNLVVKDLQRFSNMIKDMSAEQNHTVDDDADNLESLTKEELIARLREKSK